MIAERGSHQVLLAQNGIYAAMWNRQHEVMAAEEVLRRAAAAEGVSQRKAIEADTPADALIPPEIDLERDKEVASG